MDNAPQSYTPVKIAFPRLGRVMARTRLFDVLDSARQRRIVWITAPPGSGKTTLTASYLADRGLKTLWYQVDEGDADIAGFFYYMGLAAKKAAPRRKKSLPLFTPEYALGLPVFARRYFEQLCSWMKPPFALVLDNYQMAPAGSPLHEAISDALELMPEGGITIIISREQPPAAYARLRANQDLALIEWDDLRLDEKEIGELIRFNGRSLPDSAELERLHSLTDGWLTGLLLLLEASRGRELQDDPRDCLPGDRSPQVVFDYFATEILERQDIVTQEFLMQVALLPRMTTGMAYKLTGVQQSEKILNHLHQTRYFIERHAYDDSLYQFHPLFREFLLTRLRHICSDAEHSRLQHRSARVLEEAGQIEAAVHSYLAAGDWTEAARLVPRHAQEFITQGRGETVIHWIRQFPEVVTEDIPWLRFWQGIVQIGTDPREARKPLEQAYWVFNKVHDLPGMTMTLAKIVETFSYGWYDMFPLDGWIDELEALLAANPDLQVPEFGAQISVAMFVALMYRRPNHPDMERWIQQTREISRHVPNANDRVVIGMQLATYYVLWGRHHDMEILLEELRPLLKDGDVSPLGIIALHALEALYYTRSLVGDGVGTAFAGLEHARQSGVYVMNPILLGTAAISSLNAGELDAARDFLAQSATLFHPARLMDQAQYHWNRGHLAWLQGEIEDAVDHVRQCEALAIQFGSVFHENLIAITAAKILVEAGEYQEAEKIVENTLSAVREINNPALEYECLLVMANIAFVQHDNAAGLEILRDALTVMKRIGAESTIWWNPKWIVPLLAQALDADIEVGFVQSLIRKHRLVPGEQHLDATHWPWPIKIRTFGGFELLLDDTMVQSSGKGQKKPLDLLKVLVAFGGQNVGENQISDALWPDAEGDDARHSLKTTVHRLRRLLGYEQAIRIDAGKLSLNPHYCWTDVWAFDRLLEPDGGSGVDGVEVTEKMERALQLYKGGFLDADTEESWLLGTRERLRSRYLRAVQTLGSHYENNRLWEQAMECYERGICMDELAESVYLRLMSCHVRLGRSGEALTVYERYRKVLAERFGVEPSEKVQALVRQLQS